MSIAAELPTRRNEAWNYSDLRQAVGAQSHVLRDGRDIIERLAPGTQRSVIATGEQRLFVERMDDDRHMDARSFEFSLEPGASLTRVVIQTGKDLPLSVARVRIGAHAKYTQFVLALGGRLARIETHVDVEGEDAEVTLNGAYLAGGRPTCRSYVNDHSPGAQRDNAPVDQGRGAQRWTRGLSG